MKRVGNLTERIAELDNLYLAFAKACRGKQRKREVQDFREHFDENMSKLRSEILSGDIQVGQYHYFTIRDPKERIICAAPFRERVLHHAIMNVCHEHFDRSLIDTTYATRPDKGVYAAIDKAVCAASRYEWMVKLDFRKYYDSINHIVLKQLLERKFKDKTLLRLFFRIIDSYHAETDVGLPIGNLTSQYFANLYLSDFDHRAKEVLRVPIYIRYMDDILMAGNNKRELMESVREMEAFALSKFCLTLKPPICHKSKDGVVFLGYRVLPHHYLLAGRSKRRFRTKMIAYGHRLHEGVWEEQTYQEHILPLLSYVQQADCKEFRRSCVSIIEKGDNRRVGLTA